MRVKVNGASGVQLDWMVTYALYGEQAHYIYKHSKVRNQYSANWGHAVPIIEGEGISIAAPSLMRETWVGFSPSCEVEANGPTPLIAAMRCLVASRLGDVVDVPEEICQ